MDVDMVTSSLSCFETVSNEQRVYDCETLRKLANDKKLDDKTLDPNRSQRFRIFSRLILIPICGNLKT